MQLVLQLGQVLFLKSKRDTCLSEKERALVWGFPKFLLMGILPLSHDWACLLSHLSRVRLFLKPWTVAHHVPQSAGLSRQEYWSGCRFLLQGPSWPGDRTTSDVARTAVSFLTAEPPREPLTQDYLPENHHLKLCLEKILCAKRLSHLYVRKLTSQMFAQ